MNRRHFLSCLALAPVAGVLARFGFAGVAEPSLATAIGVEKYEPVIRPIWGREQYPRPITASYGLQRGEARQVFTTHNVGQSDAYQTEHQIVFNGTEWVDA